MNQLICIFKQEWDRMLAVISSSGLCAFFLGLNWSGIVSTIIGGVGVFVVIGALKKIKFFGAK